jgi:hypothetical protein
MAEMLDEERREAPYRVLYTSVDDYDLDEDPAIVAEDLRRIRAEIAARRRARKAER